VWNYDLKPARIITPKEECDGLCRCHFLWPLTVVSDKNGLRVVNAELNPACAIISTPLQLSKPLKCALKIWYDGHAENTAAWRFRVFVRSRKHLSANAPAENPAGSALVGDVNERGHAVSQSG
jgi:hypothetical protein